MPVTKLAEDLPINSDGKINRADILAKAMNNVRDKIIYIIQRIHLLFM